MAKKTSETALKAVDPLNINARLYKQLDRLLDDMEAADRDDRMTMPQRINCLIAVGRIQVMFANLRKAANVDSADAGSTVRKYASAFAKNAARSGAPGGRPAFEPFADDAEPDGFGGDDNAA